MISPFTPDYPQTHTLPVHPRASVENGGLCQERFAGISFSGCKGFRLEPRESPLDRVAPRVLHFRPRPVPEEVPLEEGVLKLLSHVFTAEGLELSAYSMAPLVRRVPACLRALRVDSVEEAHNLLRESPMFLEKAINALLISTTNFFRDPAMFHEIRRQVLPHFMKQKKAPRVWSIACSDGSELYSMALLLEREGLAGGDLLGTDCRADAVLKARAGIYPATSLDEIPPEFHPQLEFAAADQILMPDVIRRRALWQVADALKPTDSFLWDIILCRNFSIYLDSASSSTLWENLEKSLAPGGFLLVGKAEKPKHPSLIWMGSSIYQKANHDADS